MFISVFIFLNSGRTLLHQPRSPMQAYPMCQKMDINCDTFVRFTEKHKKFFKKVVEIISTSWRDGTEKRCKSHIKKFVEFCAKRNEDPIPATDEIGIKFLKKYHNTGVGYSSVNSARLVLLSIKKPVDLPFGRSTLVCMFMKGVFNTLTPALPKHFIIF